MEKKIKTERHIMCIKDKFYWAKFIFKTSVIFKIQNITEYFLLMALKV